MRTDFSESHWNLFFPSGSQGAVVVFYIPVTWERGCFNEYSEWMRKHCHKGGLLCLFRRAVHASQSSLHWLQTHQVLGEIVIGPIFSTKTPIDFKPSSHPLGPSRLLPPLTRPIDHPLLSFFLGVPSTTACEYFAGFPGLCLLSNPCPYPASCMNLKDTIKNLMDILAISNVCLLLDTYPKWDKELDPWGG